MKLRIKTKLIINFIILIINCIILIATLFTEKLQIQNKNITAYLNQISIPVLTGKQSQTCEGPISKNELLKALKICQITTKEFYEMFWEDLKKPLCVSITKAFHRGELSHSQKQAVIKLIEKQDRDKKIIKNWRRFRY